MPAKKQWRSFEEAREWARGLGITGVNQWREYYKREDFPKDIPTNPNIYYQDKGWVNFGDFFGTDVVATYKRKYRNFAEARVWARSLELKNKEEWTKYSNTIGLPDDIPASPDQRYKAKGWISWGNWLGTDKVANQLKSRNYLPFFKAREWARSLKLGTSQQWVKYTKRDDFPNYIPVDPRQFYLDKGWSNFGDWLGTDNVAPKDRVFRNFNDAWIWAKSLGLKGLKDWQNYRKNGLPDDIPTNPNLYYKDKGWISWGDWLGTDTIAPQLRNYLPYLEAREWAQKKQIAGESGWREYKNNNVLPSYIPSCPEVVYRDKGWLDWGDFLGYEGRWTSRKILVFVKSIKPYIKHFTPAEMMAIMRQKGVPQIALRTSIGTSGRCTTLLDIFDPAITPIPERVDTFQELEDVLSTAKDEDIVQLEESEVPEEDGLEHLADSEVAIETPANLVDLGLQPYISLEAVEMLDGLVKAVGCDEDTIEFLISNKIGELWRLVFDTQNIEAVKRDIISKTRTEYGRVIAQRFMEQYNGACEIEIPADFSGQDGLGGKTIAPNLMQRLICYLLGEKRRMGNWSGTGAGKTLSAILASRVHNLHTTLVVANNSSVRGWREKARAYFPHNTQVVGLDELHKLDDKCRHRYIILNYEKFQAGRVNTLIDTLLGVGLDFIVIDEMQNIKNRDITQESRRRKALRNLVVRVAEQTPDIYVLGMTATPVINNLRELRSLLEIVLGRDLSHIQVRHTVANAQALHEELVRNGVRYKIKLDALLQPEQFIEVDGSAHLSELLQVEQTQNWWEKDRRLMQIKADEIIRQCKPGTVVYTEFVKEIVPFLKRKMEASGLRVGLYTGDETPLAREHILDRFIGDGVAKVDRVDVLIGSSAIGTGVDRLQKACNRIVFASLPFTQAEYEQVVGRVYRQGSAFDSVDIIIPQVVYRVNTAGKEEVWSPDKERWDGVCYKRTIMDCAVDGVVPTIEKNRGKFEKKTRAALKHWINRLESGIILDNPGNLALNQSTIPDDQTKPRRGMASDQVLSRVWSTMRSEALHVELKKRPSRWHDYHKQLREFRAAWSEIPALEIAKKLEPRKDWVVADLGCGEALVADALPQHHIRSFDHVAIDERVVACDIAHLPVEDSSFDAAVMCLVFMGSNWKDYLKEAYRTLKPLGSLFVVQTQNMWPTEEKQEKLANIIEEAGFRVWPKKLSAQFIYLEAQKV